MHFSLLVCEQCGLYKCFGYFSFVFLKIKHLLNKVTSRKLKTRSLEILSTSLLISTSTFLMASEIVFKASNSVHKLFKVLTYGLYTFQGLADRTC